VRVREQGAGRGRELLTAIFVQADVEPYAAIDLARFASLRAALASRSYGALVLCDILVAASGAAHDAIRPAHLADVLKALFVSRKLYEDFAEADRLGMDSLWHEETVTLIHFCVK
jgi:hypothetical protein